MSLPEGLQICGARAHRLDSVGLRYSSTNMFFEENLNNEE
jgi:hypothetical protein